MCLGCTCARTRRPMMSQMQWINHQTLRVKTLLLRLRAWHARCMTLLASHVPMLCVRQAWDDDQHNQLSPSFT